MSSSGDAHPARDRWPAGALLMVVVGLLLLSAPSRFEGPVLLPVSPGHALSVLDAVAVIPLTAGSLWVYHGLWRRRGRLRLIAANAPGLAGAIVFSGGVGLGLLIASAFSAFFWWWAIGAVFFGGALLAAALAGARNAPARATAKN